MLRADTSASACFHGSKDKQLYAITNLSVGVRNVVYLRIQCIKLILAVWLRYAPLPAYASWKSERCESKVSSSKIQEPVPGLHPGPHQLPGPVFPSSAYSLASVAAKVVFPTPPFPVTAYFHNVNSPSSFYLAITDVRDQLHQMPIAALFSSILSIILSPSLSISFSTVYAASTQSLNAALSAGSATSVRTGYIRVNAKEGIETGCYYVVSDGNCLLRHPLRSTAYYRKLRNVQSGILGQLCKPEPSYG